MLDRLQVDRLELTQKVESLSDVVVYRREKGEPEVFECTALKSMLANSHDVFNINNTLNIARWRFGVSPVQMGALTDRQVRDLMTPLLGHLSDAQYQEFLR